MAIRSFTSILSYLFSIVFVLLFIFLIPNVLAISINFNFPDEVYQIERFEIEINSIDGLKSNVNYDLKICVNYGDKTISEILDNDKWKSCRYYVNSVWPTQSNFLIRVMNNSGKYELCVKVRENGKSAILGEACKDININPIREKNKEDITEFIKDDVKDVVVKEVVVENIDKNISDNLVNDAVYQINLNEPVENNEPIKLNNANTVNTVKTVGVYYTGENSFRENLVYWFLGFSVFIIVLISLRKL